MKKIFSLLLSFVLLLSACTFSVHASDDAITLSFEFSQVSLFAGTKITLHTATAGEVEKVRLLFSEDNDSYSVIEEISGEASPSFVTELLEGPNWFMAHMTDGDGNILASSEPIMIEGYGEAVVRDLWDVDFDFDITAVQKSATSTTIQFIDSNGTEIKNSDSSKLAADIGVVDSGNSVLVESSDVDSYAHGKAIKIVTASGNGSKVSQLNSLGATVTGTDDNAVLFQMDYLFESNNSKTTVMAINDGSAWYSALMLESGILKFAGKTFTPELGQWYTVSQLIDFSNDTVTCFIDGKILGSVSCVSNAGKTTRMRFSHEKASSSKDSVTWVDNFTVKEVKFQKISKQKVFTVSAVNYSSPIYSGNKTSFSSDVQNYSEAAEVQFFVSPDGSDYSYEASALPGKSGDVTLPYETTYVKAVLLNSDGEELAETEPEIFETVGLTLVETVWDIDFESQTTAPGTSNGVYICDKNGEYLKNAYGNTFIANSGSAESTVEIADNPVDADHGKALRLYVGKSGDEVQINELKTTVMSDVIMAQWDTCFSGESSEYVPLRLWYLENSSTDSRYVGPYLKQGVTSVSFEGSGARHPMAQNTWYNMKIYVNTKTKEASCYINDKYLGTMTTSKDIYSLLKVTNTIKGEGAQCYVDNIRVERLCFKPEIVDAESIDDKTLKINFANPLPEDFFAENLKEAITLTSGINPITVKEAVLSDDGTYLTVKCAKKLYTSVDTNITISLSDGILLEKTVNLAPADFDITDVSFTNHGSALGAKATVVNNTDETKSVIMFFVVEKDGAIISVSTSAKEFAPLTTGEMSVPAQNLAGGNAKVFFLDNWTNLAPVKTYVYTR